MGLLIASALVASITSACSPADSSTKDALSYAMKACGIKVDENGEPVRDENGRVARIDDFPRQNFDITMGRLTEFEERVTGLKSLASSANAAAQLDQVWQPLATNLSTRLAFEEKWLQIRNEGKAPGYVIPNINEQIDTANVVTREVISICGGLSERLSR
jgi:hypothetical protein